MTDDELTDDEQFLDRWSRRKTATRPETKEQPAVAAEPAMDSPPLAESPDTPPEIDPETLPDIDSLDETSDFTVFMQNGVPEALRNRALRKLWQTDPIFNVVDGLVEYGEDYTNIAAIAETIQSVYKVGKGMVDEADDDNEGDDDTDEAVEDVSGESGPIATQDNAALEERQVAHADPDIADQTERNDNAIPRTENIVEE